MQTATLPIRYELVSGGSGSASDMRQICCLVAGDGGTHKGDGIPRGIGMPTGTSVTARRPVLSIRPKLTFNGVVNRTTILPISINILNFTNDLYYEIVHDGNLTNANFLSVGSASVTEYDNSATAISGGHVIYSGFVLAAGSGSHKKGEDTESILLNFPLNLDIDGVNPVNLSIVGIGIGGAAVVHAALNWEEFFH